jgi:hypothetical protein
MSDAPTFSAPSGPTSGLQRYNLERGAKQLYPATIAGLMGRLRLVAARRRRKAERGTLEKDNTPMPNDTLKELIGTLQLSVSEILAKGEEGQRDALLTQTFTEFGEAADGMLAKLAPAGAEEADLYKGLGTVGRVAQFVTDLNEKVKNIKAGYELWGRPLSSDGQVQKGEDPASENVGVMLDGIVHLGELALRAAVNEHVDLHDDGEEVPDGFRLVTVPIADAPDDPTMAVVVKTQLPAGLAKFATDPAQISEQLMGVGIDHMLLAGVSPKRLEKALGIEGLAKAFPPKEDGEDEDEGDGEGEGEEGGEQRGGRGMQPEDEGDPDMQGGADEAADSPIEVLGRLGAALMIQIAHVQDMYEGGGEDGMEGEGQGQAAPEMEQGAGGEGEEEEGKKPPFAKGERGGDLKKVEDGETAALRKQVDDLTAELRKIGGQPAAPKGVLMTVSKEQDGLAKGEDGGDLKKVEGETPEEKLAKMAPEDRALAGFKMALAKPVATVVRPGRP